MKKYAVFGLFLLGETLICIGVATHIYAKHEEKKREQIIENVAQIDAQNISFDTGSQFKYYSILDPNVKEVEKRLGSDISVTYTYNNDGMNDGSNYSVEKEPSTYRVMALGDSFTFGHYVDTADSWPEQLEVNLNKKESLCGIKKFEVLNLGMRGFDVPYTIERYKTIGAKYNPDFIIWFEPGTGFNRYNELSQPLIKNCDESEVQKKSGLSKKEIISRNFNCWTEAERQIADQYGIEYVKAKTQEFFESFFPLVDPTKVGFLTLFDSKELMQDRLKNHPESPFFGDIKFNKKDSLPDNHPSKEGHAKVAKAAEEMILKRLSESCPTN